MINTTTKDLMGRRTWTAKELIQVKQWQEQGILGKIQAQRLNRTYISWKSMIGYRGLERFKLGERHSNYKPEYRLLVIDLIGCGFNQTAIARHMKIAHSKISRIVAELIAAGIIIKEGRKGPYRVTKEWR